MRYPLGVYHPHAEKHNIKKENIGLIEVMGQAIPPARLKTELQDLADYIIEKETSCSNEALENMQTARILPAETSGTEQR